MTKKIITSVALLALVLTFSSQALGASIDVGNSATNRDNLDGYSNFTIVDTNNAVSANGTLDTFTYYAENTNSFEFVLVDSSNVVKWISPTITPSAGEGVKTWTPASGVGVLSGWNLGVHFDSTGTIPFEFVGASAPYTPNGSGTPTVGSTLTIEDMSNRTYSFGATGTDTLLGTLSAEDFGVMNASGVKGYTAGFGLTDATFENVQSVVIKLYSGATLLQTNTATAKVGDEITGNQISSPFDVFGNFDYVADGYWVNVRGAEYGQNLIPTRVEATVTLENGKVVTAENTNLTGDPEEIFPDSQTLNVALAGTGSGTVTSSPVGIDCGADCTESYDHGTDVTLTATAALGSNFTGWSGACTGTLSCVVHLDATKSVTATFTLDDVSSETPSNKDECKNGGWKTFTNPTFKNQGQCVSFTNHNR